MKHKSEQAQIFYILSNIDYSKEWEDIEYELGYDLGDHSFQSNETYSKVRLAAKNLWAVLNGHLKSDGNPLPPTPSPLPETETGVSIDTPTAAEGFTPGKWELFGSVVAVNNGDDDVCEVFNTRDRKLILHSKDMYRALKRLLPIIEAERTQTGVSLSIRYLTEYEEANKILNSITGGK